jgi:hypothetical protein
MHPSPDCEISKRKRTRSYEYWFRLTARHDQNQSYPKLTCESTPQEIHHFNPFHAFAKAPVVQTAQFAPHGMQTRPKSPQSVTF